MSTRQKSFWSTTAGAITGIAGVATAIGGLVGVAAQVGWIGDSDGSAGPAAVTTTTSLEAGGGGGASGSRSTASGPPRFTFDPTSVVFESLGPRAQTAALRNTGDAPLEVESTAVEGANAENLAADGSDCTGGLVEPGRSCQIEVSFKPSGAGDYRATLVVAVDGAPDREIPLRGTAIL